MKTKFEISVKQAPCTLYKDVEEGSYFVWCGVLYRKMYGNHPFATNYVWIANIEDENVVQTINSDSRVKVVKKLKMQLEF